jgi:hypothetical protein
MPLIRHLEIATRAAVSGALRVPRELNRMLAAGSVDNARNAARESRQLRAMRQIVHADQSELRKLA